MVGLCLKNAYYLNHYCFYLTNAAFCISLHEGRYYYKNNRSTGYVRGRIGEIYSAVIYPQENKIRFFLNGSPLSFSKTINDSNEEDFIFLCPFGNLHSNGDQVSIVEFDNFNK